METILLKDARRIIAAAEKKATEIGQPNRERSRTIQQATAFILPPLASSL